MLKAIQTRFEKGVLGPAFVAWLAPLMLAGVLGGMAEEAGVAQPPAAVVATAIVGAPGIEAAFFVKPREAIEWFRNRNIVSPEEFKLLDATAKARAFSVAGLTDIFALSLAEETIADGLYEGLPTSQWLTALEERFASAGLGTDTLTNSHWRLVYEQNEVLALGAGRTIQQERVKDVRPFGYYYNPNPKTAVCSALAGKVFRLSDPGWRVYLPPNHFGCKSLRLTMNADEVAARGLEVTSFDAIPNLPPVQEGFAFDAVAAFFLNRGPAGMTPSAEGQAALEQLT